jgi:hypothetical protein
MGTGLERTVYRLMPMLILPDIVPIDPGGLSGIVQVFIETERKGLIFRSIVDDRVGFHKTSLKKESKKQFERLGDFAG